MLRQSAPVRAGLLVAVAGASAVLLGAFGAHALRGVLNSNHVQLWHTAVRYQMWHALALGLVAVAGVGRGRRIALTAFAAGTVLFSGSLYALALGAPHWIGILTPLGGLALVVGWVALGFSLRSRCN